MTIAGEVKIRVKKMKEGVIISYKSFTDLDNQGAVALALSRLCKEDKIRRLQKGWYYKPKMTAFGELEPSEAQIIQALVEGDAYMTGASTYNWLGLTTQVPNEITIMSNKYPRQTKVGTLKVRYVQETNQKLRTRSENLLQLLDVFKNIKRMPGSDVSETFKRLSKIVERLDEEEQKSLAKLALQYKPSVRALVGAVLENCNEKLVQKLKKSLNPLSIYKIGLDESAANNLNDWRIQ